MAEKNNAGAGCDSAPERFDERFGRGQVDGLIDVGEAALF